MKAPTRALAGLGAAAILLMSAAAVSGYVGQVAATVTIATVGEITCDEPFTLKATILDAAGAPVDALSVDWSFVTRQSDADTITKTPTVTNADGVATTTVALGSANGDRQIRATAGDVRASIVVTGVCGGLPRTSTLAPGDVMGASTSVVLPLILFVLAAGLGGAVAFRRMR